MRKILISLGIFIIMACGLFFAFRNNLFSEESKKEIQINKINPENVDINNSEEDISKNIDDVKNEESAGEKVDNQPKIVERSVNWGYQKSSGRSIDTIIIHSSYNALGGDEYNTDKLIGEYKSYGVSPHYFIDRAGNIYRLVEDKDIAYHAGASKTPDGRKNVNSFSIGIEMMNTKSDKFTVSQYNSLKSLLAYLKGKYKIEYVLGHNQIAPGRKDDPWNFDWEKIK
jgi:N-acetyl-anhydromuramyl-L-alanine amidase AmpD